jgi:ABC-type nitrate/sulfonate/bicarbonate transport system ATPase subunit
MRPHVEVSRLGKSFDSPAGRVPVVEDFDLQLAQGEFVCLIGHSGCGKSTVLSIVAGLAESTSGGVILDGREIDGPGPDRGVVFQSPSLLPWLSAHENVLLGVDRVYPHGTRAERHAIATHFLELVGLGDALESHPPQLSRRHRARVRACAEAAAAGRAVRNARFADAHRAAAGAARALGP